MRSTFLLASIVLSPILRAQTYTGSGGPIPDDGSTAFFSCPVSGLVPTTLDTVAFGVMEVCINLTHTYDADLEISLVAPDGTTVPLSIGNGGSGNNYLNTCFRQDASASILNGTPPFNGTYRPQGQLGLVNNGQLGNGAWALKIYDNYPSDAGTLFNWNITFGNDPAGYFAFTESDLPIVVINTNGQVIVDEPKLMADMGIIWNGPGLRNHLSDPFNHYEGKIGIERRGATSATMPKKSYGVETWDLNAIAIDTALFDMPSENDWVLSAGYPDKTLFRNAFTYGTARAMGRYAPRTMHVDVLLNGEYIGVYTFCEKVKRDEGRVDIAKLLPTDVLGDELTGGYIVKVDKTTGSGGDGWYSLLPPAFNSGGADVAILYDEPDQDDIVAQQANYIEAYVDSFELSLLSAFPADTSTGYPHFIDPVTFADQLLVNELTKNGDGYRISTFYHKDKNSNGGKLKAGPVWDYDVSSGNGDYCDIWRTDGWAYEFNTVCGTAPNMVSGWWQELVQDPTFQRVLRCRWEELKVTALSPSALEARMDSLADLLNESQGFNFQVWPIMGAYTWPNYYIAEDYQGEVDTMKWFIQERWNWLDAQLPQVSVPCSTVGIADAGAMPDINGARFVGDDMLVNLPSGNKVMLDVLDARGRIIASGYVQPDGTVGRITMTGAAPGLYLVRPGGPADGAWIRAVKTD
ncbi:MAG: CotH kinase family protein [Flavobacteriales bacterium]|nr:CotH kinase family protein [Flavobacteriales bacterium]